MPEMPVFAIRSPEGAVYQLRAPDEATAVRLFDALKAANQLPPRVGSQGQTTEPPRPGPYPGMERAEAPQPIPPRRGFGERVADVAQSLGTGVVRGAGELATLPITIGRGVDAVMDAAGIPQMGGNANQGPLGQAQDAMRGFFDRTLHQPTTTEGEFARTIGEFAPGALVAPGSIAGRLTRFAAVPGGISEAAGQMTQGKPYEPWFRLGGAVAGSGIGGLGARSRPPAAVLRGRIQDASVDDINRAEQMILQAEGQGVSLTWPEALHSVTNGRVDITDVQRVLEQLPGGRRVMSPFMANRPGQVEQAAARAIRDVGATGTNLPATSGRLPRRDPYQTGNQLQEMADQALSSIRQRINAVTEPLYQAAGPTRVDPTAFAALRADPLFVSALRAVKSDPVHARYIQGLPDDSVGVLNEVKKWMDDMSGRSRAAGGGGAAGTYEGGAADVRQTARAASPEYGQALDTQSALRGRDLAPRQAGPLGQIAGTNNILRQGEAVLPRVADRIVPGMEGEVHQTMRALVAQDPEAATQLVTTQLQSLANEALAQSPTGINQYGGAIFANMLRGNSQQARNLRAVVTALPGGGTKIGALNQILLTLEATGRRQRPGSQTTFNTELQNVMGQGGAVGTAATLALSPPRALTYLRDAYTAMRLGRNTNQLARILTDPGAAPLLQELLRARSATDKARIVATLFYNAEQTRQGNIGAGTPQPLSFAPLQ